MTKTNVTPQDAPTLASDAELAAHAADTTSVHGIADTSVLSTTSHVHAGADITSGTVADARIASTLARDSEVTTAVGNHEADTTSIHGIADTSALSLTSHDHTGTYEPSGTVATHEADTTSVHGIPDTSALVVDGDAAGGELAGTYPNPTVAVTHSGSAHHAAVTVGTGLDVTGQLVELDLSEVASGGELGGFMDAPTVDASHSGSTHAATQAAAEATAAGALTTHEGAADPHPGYLTAAEGNAAYQPMDSDLTAIAALTTTAFGRGLLELANAAALASAHSHDPIVNSYAPGSFTVPDGDYTVMTKRLQLTTTQRVTLAGTARVRIT